MSVFISDTGLQFSFFVVSLSGFGIKMMVASELIWECSSSQVFWKHFRRIGVNFSLKVLLMGFPGSSAGEESACNAGEPSSIPGLGRSSGEGMGYPPQYSWASLVAQLVKNLPAIRETWVQSLGWEDPLEKGKATHSSILA